MTGKEAGIMNTGRGAFGRIEAAFDRRAEKFTFRHPYLTILIMFIAVPLGCWQPYRPDFLAAFPAALLFGLV